MLKYVYRYNQISYDVENGGVLMRYDDKVYDLFEKACDERSMPKIQKTLKKVLELAPDHIDARMMLAEFEEDEIKKLELFREAIELEKQYLTKEGYFEDQYMGSFYGVFETRPYLRGLYAVAQFYRLTNKITKAIQICEEIIELNENDNLGARYLLINSYVMLEQFDQVQILFDQYEENSIFMLLPLAISYYKQDEYDSAREIIKQIHESNPNFYKVFNEDDDLDEDEMSIPGYYSRGSLAEVAAYMEDNEMLLYTNTAFISFYIETIE